MQINVIHTLEAFESLSEEWNQLHTQCSASHVPFLRHEYLRTWWHTKGGGEWQEAELFIVTARNTNGELIGIAPLFYTSELDRRPSLLLLGSIEISDYLDFIFCADAAPQFFTHLFTQLATPQAPPWEQIVLYNLLESSPSLPLLEEAARENGWGYTQEKIHPCPYIPLPSDWETYLAQLDKKQRHELRRKMRRAQEHEPPMRWYIVEDEESLTTEIEEFLDLMAQDPEKDAFLTPKMRTQMRAAAQVAFRAGWLQLAFLEFGREKAAGYLNFDFGGHIWVYNSALNFAYSPLSPGWVLLGCLLQWAIEHKRTTFDFMRGGEEYKYRLGGINRYVLRVTITR